MTFTQALGIRKGITAIIGSGGKTSLMLALATELASPQCFRFPSVVLCTSTKIYPPEGIPLVERISERVEGILCVGTPALQGKIGAPQQDISELSQYADYVLVEADGSKHLPLKAHEVYEPVIPESCDRIILVIGATGIGKPVEEAVHRSEIFTRLTGSLIATAEAVALAVEKEGYGDIVFINQADSAPQEARALSGLLQKPTCVGSVQKGEIICLY